MTLQKRFTLFLSVLLMFTFVSKAQVVTGVYTGYMQVDSPKNTINFELTLKEKKGKLYGYCYRLFTVEDTLYYNLVKVSARISNDVLIVEDEGSVSNNFENNTRGIKTVFFFKLKDIKDTAAVLPGEWSTARWRGYLPLTGKVTVLRERNYKTTQLYKRLADKKLDESMAFEEPTPPAPAETKPLPKPVVAESKPKDQPATDVKPKTEIVKKEEAVVKNEKQETKPSGQPTGTEFKPKEQTNQPVAQNQPPVKKEEQQVVKNDKPLPKQDKQPPAPETKPKEQTNQPVAQNQPPVKKEEQQVVKNDKPLPKQDKQPSAPETKPKEQTNQPVAQNQPPVKKEEQQVVKNDKPLPKTDKQPPAPETKPKEQTNQPVAQNQPPVKKEEPAIIPVPEKPQAEISKTGVVTHPDSLKVNTNFVSGPPSINNPVLVKRQSELIETLTIYEDSVTLSLYDNGEIDGDVVSVFLNNEEIISKVTLNSTAYKKTIYLQPGQTIQLSLYAETLGSIPPNTGLLVIYSGEKRYQVFFSATLEKSAVILLKRSE